MTRFIVIMLNILFTSVVQAQDISNYLITTDIATYKKITKGGTSSSVLAGARHFSLDHQDAAYGIAYVNDMTEMWIDVRVTTHTGEDSDKWLLHELERDFRNYYGIPGDSYVIRQIDGHNILAAGSGGWHYRWLSGNKVISIEYTDLQMEKPEPLDVVKAYLAKYPSILTPVTSADLRTSVNKTKWIKDEMERRLWLCDKWFEALQLEKAEMNKVVDEAVDHMIVFLDYREKYYGISAKDEKQALWSARSRKDGTSIKNKLEEYKNWWAANKGEEINL